MLISAVLPIMSFYKLPHGQYGYSGHVINLPQDVASFANSLPRPLAHHLRNFHTSSPTRLLMIKFTWTTTKVYSPQLIAQLRLRLQLVGRPRPDARPRLPHEHAHALYRHQSHSMTTPSYLCTLAQARPTHVMHVTSIIEGAGKQ